MNENKDEDEMLSLADFLEVCSQDTCYVKDILVDYYNETYLPSFSEE